MVEEIADVRVCLDVLEDATGTIDTIEEEAKKITRWRNRLKAYYAPNPEPVRSYHEYNE